MTATLVAAGILLSRLLGIVRESLKARYLGATGSIAADAFNAAFRIPNLLQNLLGEGALSASFIPVYSNLLARGNKEEASRLAGAIGTALALVTAVVVALGIGFAPALVDTIAWGFEGERRDLTIQLTRILFPGAALFVFSAWCLGILNSHRRFFLSYAAPVAWNGAMIVALVWFADESGIGLAGKLAVASVAGAALQFLVQLPVVLSVAPQLRLALARSNEHVREVARNFVPAFFARGIVQVNGYLDQFIASLLPIGSVSLVFYAQTITLLPISLFGMSIAAAELPEMSSATGDDSATGEHVRSRLQDGLGRLAFFIVPSAMVLFAFGDVVAAALYQHGRFSAGDTRYTWGILAAASVGLYASTAGRLYSSAFYALRDTRTPLRFAIVRVTVAGVVGFFAATSAVAALRVDPVWGTAALTLTSSVAGWIEFVLLRNRLRTRIGATGVGVRLLLVFVGAAVLAAGTGWGIKLALGDAHRVLMAAAVLGAFSAVYIGVTAAAGVETARALVRKVSWLVA